VSRRTGEITRIATGAAFSQLAADADALYVTEPRGPSRALVRVRKDGSRQTLDDGGVRDGPIAAFAGWVYYLEEDDRPSLRRVATTGGASALVARSVALRHVTAMTVDASAIYVAGGEGPDAVLIEMPIVALPPATE
jgi:hypothetical protein